jgi:long-chain acyl-CoA synthetase
MSSGTVHEEVLGAAASRKDDLFQRADGGRVEITYGAARETVLRAARGLVALGLRRGDRVAIVAENSPRWLHADLAVLAAGGIDVPRGATAPEREVAAIVRHADCRLAFVENAAVLTRTGSALADVKTLILLEGDAPGDTRALTFERLLEMGEAEVELPQTGPDDVATLVYTSGTTGEPKGVTLLHRNIVSNIRALHDVLPIGSGQVLLSLLPTWHMYERTVEYFVATRGAVIAYPDLKRLRKDLGSERPHLMVSVPRVWEKLHDGVLDALRGAPMARRLLGDLALRGSLVFTRARRALAGLSADTVDASPLSRLARLPGLFAWPLHLLARPTVHAKIRSATGGRLLAAVSGGAAMPPHVDLFFSAAGVTLLVGYGLTETSPVLTVRRLDRNVLGTIGVALAGTELRVVDPTSGEVLANGAVGALEARGPQVMKGYWEDAAATSRVLSRDGWFATGDLVSLTGRGDVVFCGRAKDTIVLAGGENVEPEALEQAARASPCVDQIVVVGQDRKTLGALVWPNADAVNRALGTQTPTAEAVLALLRTELDARVCPAAGFRPWERLQRVALLPGQLTPEAGTLTATLKTRRAEVARRHADLIEAMYAQGRPV